MQIRRKYSDEDDTYKLFEELQQRLEKLKKKNIKQMLEKLTARSKIEELMWKNDMSAHDFAKKMGISQPQAAIYIAGKTKSFHLETLQLLCKVLKTTPSELYNFKDKKE